MGMNTSSLSFFLFMAQLEGWCRNTHNVRLVLVLDLVGTLLKLLLTL